MGELDPFLMPRGMLPFRLASPRVPLGSSVLISLGVLVDFINAITGWWYTYPSEKYEFVSWDLLYMTIPNIWKIKKKTNHQPVISSLILTEMRNQHESTTQNRVFYKVLVLLSQPFQ